MAYFVIILRYVSALVYNCLETESNHKDTEENDSTVGYWQILWSTHMVGYEHCIYSAHHLHLAQLRTCNSYFHPRTTFHWNQLKTHLTPHWVHLQSVLHVKSHSVRRIAWPWYEEEQTRAPQSITLELQSGDYITLHQRVSIISELQSGGGIIHWHYLGGGGVGKLIAHRERERWWAQTTEQQQGRNVHSKECSL